MDLSRLKHLRDTIHDIEDFMNSLAYLVILGREYWEYCFNFLSEDKKKYFKTVQREKIEKFANRVSNKIKAEIEYHPRILEDIEFVDKIETYIKTIWEERNDKRNEFVFFPMDFEYFSKKVFEYLLKK